ncbi:putative DNA-binding transcriptional regulator YafY [Fluviicoccus keumensis]|uniref:Putative DNA-binding transcriptional regulator YafY n=1 Tax=Fluviicoccus keumensis TaxID=1435465 RepID=A0A4Q7YPM2_9GAMM|nr:YafY family protein [Fluviicoccus keumensis]RZU38679.1 putative DNA-binding transcriptional regulator YafY [Fluviicoccus keumensis]
MTRTERLLQLMQILRRHRYPVSGATLAAELGISLRSLYRDIATLQGQGARIEGEAGVGYLLLPGYLLPPLMFSDEEIDALVLGSRWVAQHGDPALAAASRSALSRILSVLPEERRQDPDSAALLVGPTGGDHADDSRLTLLRQALRSERKLAFGYRDARGEVTQRTVWPVALGYFEQVRMLAGWCEQRQAFRHFRVDRMHDVRILDDRYPRHRRQLLHEWRRQEQLRPQ